MTVPFYVVRDKIEQAIARGMTATAISNAMNLDAGIVHRVWDRLDAISAESDDPQKAARCGTTSGWARHQKNMERPCVPCRAARRRYDNIRRAEPGHGTHAAYVMHQKAGTEPCTGCKAAESEYTIRRRRDRNEILAPATREDTAA